MIRCAIIKLLLNKGCYHFFGALFSFLLLLIIKNMEEKSPNKVGSLVSQTVNRLISLVMILIIIGLVVLVAWFWHQNELLKQSNESLQERVEKFEKKAVIDDEVMKKGIGEAVDRQDGDFTESGVASESVRKISKSGVDLCNVEPTATEIGRDIYPIDPKYKNIQFLGQIFTAYDCGADRVNEIFGVRNNVYSMGSRIVLKDNPNESLVNTFKEVGFSCYDKTLLDKECKEWEFSGDIKIDEIMKLEPYYENFKLDDCISCG